MVSTRIQIPPISIEGDRPVWSIMIPTYNCAKYLKETLQSVLSQDQGIERMQIEVIDDYSTKDDPEQVVSEMSNGRVRFYRQITNQGHTKNFHTCLLKSEGKYVHLLHGDDLVKQGFYEKMESLFDLDSNIGAVFCRHNHIDENGDFIRLSFSEQQEDGILNDALVKMTSRQIVQTPSIVVKREVYETIGGFDKRLSWCEDWEMWARISSKYKIAYTNDILAEYRIHTSSNSGVYITKAENLRDVKRGINIIADYVNYMPKKEYLKKTYDTYANYGFNRSQALIGINKKGAFNQWRVAFWMANKKETFKRAYKLLWAILKS